MLNRRAIVSEVLFLFLIAVTSIYYFYVGQWKSYVRLFSIVEILVLSVTLVLFVLGKVKKPHYKGTLIIFAFGILCVMQLFPMIGALVLGYRYLYNAVIHLIITILGVLNIVVLIRSQRNLA